MTAEALFPEVEGGLDERPPRELIALIDRKNLTGVLEAHDGPLRFEFVLRGGEIVSGESTDRGRDAIEGFLALEEGRYRLRQQLLLPDGRAIDRRVATGALEDAPPPVLLACCEDGGLTGTLRMRSGGELVEALFDAGVLTAVTLDGHQGVVVDDVWRWTTGEWAILARPAFEPPPDPTDTGLRFLREVEVAAVELLETASAAAAIVGDPLERPEPRGGDRTVKIVYLDTEPPAPDAAPVSSRYAETDVTAVVVYRGVRRAMGATPKLPTPGDPIKMALAKVDGPDPEEPADVPAPDGASGSDIPWGMIVATIVLLALLVAVLYLLGRA